MSWTLWATVASIWCPLVCQGPVSKDFGTYARWHDLQLISYHRTGHMSKLLSCALNHWTRQDLTRIDCDSVSSWILVPVVQLSRFPLPCDSRLASISQQLPATIQAGLVTAGISTTTIATNWESWDKLSGERVRERGRERERQIERERDGKLRLCMHDRLMAYE